MLLSNFIHDLAMFRRGISIKRYVQKVPKKILLVLDLHENNSVQGVSYPRSEWCKTSNNANQEEYGSIINSSANKAVFILK